MKIEYVERAPQVEGLAPRQPRAREAAVLGRGVPAERRRAGGRRWPRRCCGRPRPPGRTRRRRRRRGWTPRRTRGSVDRAERRVRRAARSGRASGPCDAGSVVDEARRGPRGRRAGVCALLPGDDRVAGLGDAAERERGDACCPGPACAIGAKVPSSSNTAANASKPAVPPEVATPSPRPLMSDARPRRRRRRPARRVRRSPSAPRTPSRPGAGRRVARGRRTASGGRRPTRSEESSSMSMSGESAPPPACPANSRG